MTTGQFVALNTLRKYLDDTKLLVRGARPLSGTTEQAAYDTTFRSDVDTAVGVFNTAWSSNVLVTPAAATTLDGDVAILDELKAQIVSFERTIGGAVTITTSAFDGNTLTYSGGTGVNSQAVPDNLADAWSLKEGTNAYITVVTTNGAERLLLKKQTRVVDTVKLAFGDGDDITVTWDGTDLLVAQALADSAIKWGVSGAGINHVFYGDTATRDATWDQSNDQLLFNDSAKLAIGTGAGGVGDIALSWDGTRFSFTQLTTDSEMRYGIDGAGIDQRWYGDTASAYMLWDQSADALIMGGTAKIQLQTIAAATGAAIPVTHSGSFPITQNGAETNTLAIPTFLGQQLDIFVDTDTSGARVITSAQRINQAGNTIMTLTEVGDYIRLVAISIGGALRWQVTANDGVALS